MSQKLGAQQKLNVNFSVHQMKDSAGCKAMSYLGKENGDMDLINLARFHLRHPTPNLVIDKFECQK